jgi:hypothetical protein
MGVEDPRKRHHEAPEDERLQLEPERVLAERTGEILVGADRPEHPSPR